ncbi:TetR/AcrR family transcriptional regulator [Agromyces sp. LHK192]|uniref:TetR/AcrR family transcriptional regulator n=1 Tax=Agromyces sp. LHK192 TaxID=2498704 RepID=UPI000FD82430|nr:TetR/AcrR family transcriptional regulator [Agromyces sp. LHK192]
MGQREQLLAGARTCLLERGYAHTTARDIVAANPGANLASIGYHFGSKDALMIAAVLQLIEEWGDRIAEAADGAAGNTPGERLEHFIRGVLAAGPQERQVIAASVQAYGQAAFSDVVREQFRSTYERARVDLAALILGVPAEHLSDDDAASVGSVALALINGATLQWLIDPLAARGFDDLAPTLARIGTPASA